MYQSTKNQSDYGTFFGVSVGPGDPQLMTLKAVHILKQVPIVAVPRTKGTHQLALDIAQQVVDLSTKEILPLDFLMTRAKVAMEQRHQELSAEIIAKLTLGQDVALLNLGDVSVYSTFSYLMERILAQGFPVEVVPGVTSFSAVAATLQTSLTTMSQPLHILPGGKIEDILPLSGTKVVMKTGKDMAKLKKHLQEQGGNYQIQGVEQCGLPGEKIYRSLEELEEDSGYFTTIIIKGEGI